jgi:hypothetical protein
MVTGGGGGVTSFSLVMGRLLPEPVVILGGLMFFLIFLPYAVTQSYSMLNIRSYWAIA